MTENEYNNLIKIRDRFDTNRIILSRKAPFLTTASIVFFVLSFILNRLNFNDYIYWIAFFIGIIFLTWPINYVLVLFFIRFENIESRIEDYSFQRELKENPQNYNSIMLRKNYLHLEKYFRQSLNQNRNIFIFGILISLFGIAVIPAILILNNQDATISNLIQAILVGFILVIFQIMYSKTNNSTQKFYSDLINGYETNLKSIKERNSKTAK